MKKTHSMDINGILALFVGAAFVVVAGVVLPKTAAAVECNQNPVFATDPDDNNNATNTACGDASEAGTGDDDTDGSNNTAYGSIALAGSTDAENDNTAIGANSSAQGGDATAVGEQSEAGQGAVAVGADLDDDGEGASATAIGSIALGADAKADATADYGMAIGSDQDGDGTGAVATDVGAIAIGADSEATAIGSIALGTDANADSNADYGMAIGSDQDGDGNGAVATELGAIAMGADSEATAAGAVAIGVDGGDADTAGATASGIDAVAIGTDASATHDGSTALGQGATTTRTDQMVYGTADETHTMPGLPSDASRAAQSGPLEIVTTDAMGNLASDRGKTWRDIRSNRDDIEDNERGIAMAMSLQDPDLVGDERLGMKIGWGTYGGEHAMGITVAGVVLPDIGAGIRLGVAGGAAIDLEQGDAGGRAGFQLSW